MIEYQTVKHTDAVSVVDADDAANAVDADAVNAVDADNAALRRRALEGTYPSLSSRFLVQPHLCTPVLHDQMF